MTAHHQTCVGREGYGFDFRRIVLLVRRLRQTDEVTFKGATSRYFGYFFDGLNYG